MAEIVRFLPKEHAFGPTEVEAMGHAFDLVCAELLKHSRVPSEEDVAKLIIGVASNGEKDPVHISRYVLACYGIDRRSA
jgi:hypothetical protein